ncbi:MAG: restriction endonuclease subunit S [Eubacteriales bacterium]|nr:restriction endonuclease subunit S [Eubacteriales bacterium]
MDTKALRQKILDLAIHGKLVPQDPNDEPASVLLERIREQKKQMVKEGKLKAKDIKNDTVIYVGEDNLHYEKFADGSVKCIEDEIPFGLSDGWAWTRLGAICIINPRNNITDDLEVSFVPMPMISEGYANTHTHEIRTWNTVKSGFTHFAENDIGIAKITPCFENRKSVIFKNLVNGYGAGTTELHILRTLEGTISNEYLLWIVKMDSFIQGGVQTFSGAVGQQRVGKDFLSQYLLPVPTYNEQIRIINKINLIFNFVIEIENEKSSLQEIIKKAKAKILDLAIRGQLVPQNPDDEPASVLLERIRAEKEELIKQGKIKRDKKEAIIFKGEDNSYYVRQGAHKEAIDELFIFELPDNWEWCSLLNIAKIELGKTLDSAKNTGINYPYLCSVNVRWNEVDLTDLKEMRFEPDELERYTIRRNDLLICEGGDVGRSCVWDSEDEILYQNALHRVRFYRECNPFYFMYYMMYYESRGIIKALCKGVTIKHLTGNVLSLIPFALPPIEEQHRIVESLNKMFFLLDSILCD